MNLATTASVAAMLADYQARRLAEQRTADPGRYYYLRILGDPLLRTPCAPVAFGTPEWGELAWLVQSLKRIRQQYGGMGISANQVGSTHRVFIAQPKDAETMVFVNPRYSGEQGPIKRFMQEGSLSIPGFRTMTKRHAWVNLAWADLATGEQRTAKFAGVAAWVVQHEMDQLDGKLIVDGLPRPQRRQAERLVEDFLAKQARRS